MIKIFDESIGLSNFPNDNTNGKGRVNDLDNTLTEELNGIYEGEFLISISDSHFNDLEVGSYIEIPAISGKQIFKVYEISKAINGVCTVKYQHCTYDLNKVVVTPFEATGAVASKNGMLSHILGNTPYTMTTDITNTTSVFKLDIPRNFRECLGGYEGSLLDVFRGEYEWDNLTVKMLAHRGSDNGVRIAYGKNLTDFKQEENIENVYTSVLGYAVVDEQEYHGNIYHKVSTTYPKVKIVDFSSDYESGQIPTVQELTTKAQTYAQNNDIEIPNVNLTISFVPLYQTEEYKNIAPLERVFLGDTVHVYFEKLNVEAIARVIKTVWNVNLQRYDSIELGNAKANLNTVINEAVDKGVSNALSDLDIDTGYIETEMMNMSKLIANGMGLHITKDSAGRIFLHNAEQLSNSQYQYEITSNGFMVSNDYGANWNSGWDSSGNVVVNSLATITLKFLEGYGMFMRFGDVNSNYIDVAPYTDGMSFDGTGYVRFQPKEQFLVNNLSSSNSVLNQFVLGSKGTENQAFVTLKNYDYTNGKLANSIDMDASLTDSNSVKYNQIQFGNYLTSTGSSYLQNYLKFVVKPTFNNILFENYYVGGSTYLANRLSLFANSASSTNEMNLRNYKQGYDTLYANEIYLRNQNANNTLALRNYLRGSTGNTTLANEITLVSNASGNQINITNKDSNNATINSINLSSNGTLYLTAGADARIQSSGAVRIMANYNSGSSDQDVLIQGKTIKFIREGGGHFSFYTSGSESGTRYNLRFNNDGSVSWYS